MNRLRLPATIVAGALGLAATGSAFAQATGGFFVHLNQQNVTGFSDSRRSVTFYSAEEVGSGAASPLFSVHVPGEIISLGDYNGEELSALAADPNTGDVYIASFDSVDGFVGSVEQGEFSPPDTSGDIDIYRINFSTVYDHWAANFQGTTVTAGVTPNVGGVSPALPAGAPAGGFNDYITYSSIPQTGSGLHFDDVNRSHSNTFSLPGSIEKIAEVKRNNGESFFSYSLEFVDSNTLLLLDNFSEPGANESEAENDHAYRLIERVSTAPGAADDSSLDFLDGGFNNGTTESWNSSVIGLVNRDFVDGVADGFSEPESIAYHADAASGVRGFWVTESDGGGDDIAFFNIDTREYVEQATGGGGATSFALDNDPFVDATTNDGKAEHIFVDADTGDLIIVESGFGDANDGITLADEEPAVIRREVLSYDNGVGQIEFGAWSEKIITTPNKDPGDTFLERGHWAAYDSENDQVYFYNPGGGGETPSFQNDIMVLDIATGVTTTLNNVDDSVALFFGDSFGDVADFFTLVGETGLAGDYNNDGVVDAADYTVWRDGLPLANETASPGVIDAADYAAWVAAFGDTVGGAAVPEPSALMAGVLTIGLGAASRRR